jgi:acyl-CoA synthetase (AMP-forming)/AMP-acid ligase II/acyl carrier protein
VADPVANLVASLAVWRCGAKLVVADPQLDAQNLNSLLKANAAAAIVSDAAPTDPAANAVHWIAAQQIPGGRAMRAASVSATASAAQAAGALTRADVASLLAGLSGQARLLSSDRVLCVDGQARGLQLVQALLALTEGSELVFAPAATLQDGAQLAALLRSEQVGLFHAAGATWKKLLAANAGHSLPLIAMVDVTETTPELVGALVEAGATVVSIFRPAAHAVPVAAGLLSEARDSSLFGRPLLAEGIRIVDAQGQAVPAGTAGHLHAVSNPGTAPTGLLARWRSDGVLQHLGQVGSTAFIEGCRIDTAALEQALKALPTVQDAGVAVLDDSLLHRKLVAWVQPRTPGAIDPARCAEQLRQALPAGVLNQSVTVVEQIVRLADGSLDPKLFSQRREAASSKPRLAPASPTEQALAEVWQELLGVSDVGPLDNFFDLGGTSLMAMQAVLKLEQRIGKQISPRRYVTETLAQLATAYDNAGDEESPLPKVEPAARTGMMKRLVKLVQRA